MYTAQQRTSLHILEPPSLAEIDCVQGCGSKIGVRANFWTASLYDGQLEFVWKRLKIQSTFWDAFNRSFGLRPKLPADANIVGLITGGIRAATAKEGGPTRVIA